MINQSFTKRGALHIWDDDHFGKILARIGGSLPEGIHWRGSDQFVSIQEGRKFANSLLRICDEYEHELTQQVPK